MGSPRSRFLAGVCWTRPGRTLALLGVCILASCSTPRVEGPVAWQATSLGLCEDYPEESRTLVKARRDLAVAQAAGARVLRIAFGWDAMEPAPGTYDWTFWDDFVRSATDDFGLTLIPYVCYTPKWAATDAGDDFWRSPPRDPADFGRFVEVLVRRYGGRVHTWELWNEPDNRAYWLGSPAQLATLVRAGAAAVRRADPNARVVLGGIAGEVDFLAKLLVDERLGPAIDVVNCHSYFETWHPSPIEGLPGYVESIAGLVRDTGGTQPVWMAEAGYSSVGPRPEISSVYRTRFTDEHTETAQANALVRTILTTVGTRQVELFAWYRINDLPTVQDVIGDDNNRHLGLLRVDGSAKPSLAAFRFLTGYFAQPYAVVPAKVEVRAARSAEPQVRVFRFRDGRWLIGAWLAMGNTPPTGPPQPDRREAQLRVEVSGMGQRRVRSLDAQGRALPGSVTTSGGWKRPATLEFTLRGDEVRLIEVAP